MSMETSALTSDMSLQRHPLLLPVVLESVFNANNYNDIKWSIQDLKNFRLVCKSWNEVLLSRWRSSATLRLLQNNKDVECDETMQGLFATKFAQYLLDPRDAFQLRAKPFCKYKLIQWDVDGKDFEFKNTWNNIGPLVKSFDAMHCTINPSSDSYVHLVRLLTELELPLESLCISLDEDYRIELYKLLECHGNSLKSLKVFAPPFSPPRNYEPMGNSFVIEELELWGNVFESFKFLLEMPRLKKLKMDFGCFEKLEYMQASYENRPVYPVNLYKFCFVNGRHGRLDLRMEYLSEIEVDLQLDPFALSWLAQWTPNVKSFKGTLTNHQFRIVCRKWEKLSKLCLLFGSEVNDFGITGYSDSSTPRKTVNITRLKDLKHFTLQTFCGRGKLTDLSSREGFLKCNLDYLDICVSSEFSTNEEEKLKEAICQVTVRRKHNEGECCRLLEFKRKALVPRKVGIPRERYRYLQKKDLVEAGSIVECSSEDEL